MDHWHPDEEIGTTLLKIDSIMTEQINFLSQKLVPEVNISESTVKFIESEFQVPGPEHPKWPFN